MASLSRFDSTIARFGAPPLTRSWPSLEGLQAIFEACVQELVALCRRDPTAWLSHADLTAMLYTILVQEFPAHGLAPRALHAGLELTGKTSTGGRTRQRRIRVDLALLHPDTLGIDETGAWQGSIELFAGVRRGFHDIKGLRSLLEELVAIGQAHPHAAAYLVVIGYGERRGARDDVDRLALQMGMPLLGDLIASPDDRPGQPTLL